jgi:4-azaleucine resistance transporter AzlC
MTSDAAPAASSTLDRFLLGARACIPICISVAAYGIVWGVLARQADMSVLETMLMSSIVFAGAAQFVAVDIWVPGALPIGALVLAALIVNLRFVLMTATLRPLYRDVPTWRGALSMFLVTDENWAMTMGEVAKGRGSAAFLMGGGVAAWISWLGATTTGRLLGSLIDDPARYGFDFAFTATFLALLLGMWRGRGDIVPWIVGGAAAIVASWFIEGSWHILIGGLIGSFSGACFEYMRAARAA